MNELLPGCRADVVDQTSLLYYVSIYSSSLSVLLPFSMAGSKMQPPSIDLIKTNRYGCSTHLKLTRVDIWRKKNDIAY